MKQLLLIKSSKLDATKVNTRSTIEKNNINRKLIKVHHHQLRFTPNHPKQDKTLDYSCLPI
jgi:hypothetical protein